MEIGVYSIHIPENRLNTLSYCGNFISVQSIIDDMLNKKILYKLQTKKRLKPFRLV